MGHLHGITFAWTGHVPEGDTIHRLANVLRPRIVGEKVRELRIRRAEFSLGAFEGASVVGVEAMGKHLLVHFDNAMSLHAHMGMTGLVHCYAARERKRRGAQFVAFSLSLERAEVVGYRVPRVRVLRTGAIAQDPILSALGEDLLSADPNLDVVVASLRAQGDRPLGEAIMDQGAVAGIGNVVKSEVLFRLKYDPFATVASFTNEQLLALVLDATSVLRFNVDATPRGRVTRFDGLSPRRSVSVYGRKDEPCYDCGTRIDMRRQGASRRSTYFCPRCQGCEYILSVATSKEQP